MPLTTTIFSPFMGKKKKTKQTSANLTIDDEMSLVKAAAWAWYQRGPGSEGKPMGEFDIRRKQTAVYRPSRYKLEAMKMAEQEEDADDNSKTSTGSVHCNNNSNGNNSLVDNNKIKNISKRLDQLIESTTATKLFSDRDHDEDEDDRSVSCHSSSGSKAAGTTVKKKGKKSGGYWFRHTVVCAAREDVAIRRCQLPENSSRVVKSSSTSRSRVAHA